MVHSLIKLFITFSSFSSISVKESNSSLLITDKAKLLISIVSLQNSLIANK